ncbi:MAG TPA: HEAT repeat domain-containing protein [Gemmataceae bacterium]|nr:HEAT repeat domain-containing protein [Gemmataceae bacterium]
MNWPSQMTLAPRASRPGSVVGALLLIAPAILVLLSVGYAEGLPRSVGVGVAVTLACEAIFLIRRYGAQRASASVFLLTFYAVAALVLRFNSPDFRAPNTHLLMAVGLLIPVALFASREVTATGGNARRATMLVRQLLARKEWPASYADYRNCPMIRALREAVAENAAPVLPLLAHDDVRLQVAALTALEWHPSWRKGQVESVLHLASLSGEPAVRAGACLALANVNKPRHLNAMLPFLRDPSFEVRRSAANAILWDAANRWPVVRAEIRATLSSADAANDGPLPCSGGFPPAALDDLVAWSSESGPVGKRSTQTLIRHFKKMIQEDGSPEAISRMTTLVISPKVPSPIRVELAHRLKGADAFPADIAARLLGPANPTMLRVLSAGAIVSRDRDPQAVAVLREAVKMPNREIALAAAAVVQRYLSVDLGLPVGGELPAPNSREAAEITRKVLQWATTDSNSAIESDTPTDARVPSDAAYH